MRLGALGQLAGGIGERLASRRRRGAGRCRSAGRRRRGAGASRRRPSRRSCPACAARSAASKMSISSARSGGILLRQPLSPLRRAHAPAPPGRTGAAQNTRYPVPIPRFERGASSSPWATCARARTICTHIASLTATCTWLPSSSSKARVQCGTRPSAVCWGGVTDTPDDARLERPEQALGEAGRLRLPVAGVGDLLAVRLGLGEGVHHVLAVARRQRQREHHVGAALEGQQGHGQRAGLVDLLGVVLDLHLQPASSRSRWPGRRSSASCDAPRALGTVSRVRHGSTPSTGDSAGILTHGSSGSTGAWWTPARGRALDRRPGRALGRGPLRDDARRGRARRRCWSATWTGSPRRRRRSTRAPAGSEHARRRSRRRWPRSAGGPGGCGSRPPRAPPCSWRRRPSRAPSATARRPCRAISVRGAWLPGNAGRGVQEPLLRRPTGRAQRRAAAAGRRPRPDAGRRRPPGRGGALQRLLRRGRRGASPRRRRASCAASRAPWSWSRCRCAQEALAEDAWRGAREIVLTNAVAGALAVVEVDGAPVGDGRPGPLAHDLHRILRAALGAEPSALSGGRCPGAGARPPWPRAGPAAASP